jgi:enoyl-CoA hydratase
MGGGAELLLATDLRIAEEHTTLQWRQLSFALSLGWGGAARLAREVGSRRAFRMALFQEALDARQAQVEGLVDEVVPKGEGLKRAFEMVHRIGGMAPLAVQMLKRALKEPHAQRLQHEAGLFAQTWASQDHAEAVAAFFARRAPHFEGR